MAESSSGPIPPGADYVLQISIEHQRTVLGDLGEIVSLPAGSSLIYLGTGRVDAGATSGELINTATVSLPAGQTDPDPANNSATDIDILSLEADLSITKDDGRTVADLGDPVEYTIEARNLGPADVVGAEVVDILPPELGSCSWTCVAEAGAACAPGPESGDLADTVDLMDGTGVVYTVTCTVVAASTEIVNTVSITAPEGIADLESANDSATDVDFGQMSIIFVDGFESGDTDGWSSSTP